MAQLNPNTIARCRLARHADSVHGRGVDDEGDEMIALFLTLVLSQVATRIHFAAGVHPITADWTIDRHVVFSDGSVLKPAKSVLVKLAGGYTALPRQRVFDLSAGGYCFATSASESTQYHWGAVGDLVADDTRACQALIDNCIYFRGADKVEFAEGQHLISTLHFGYGENFRGFTVEGAGRSFSNGPTFVGTFFKTNTWENGFEIAGGRNVTFRDLSLQGPWQKSLLDNDIANITEKVDSTVEANWYPANMPRDALSRYKFSCGIHVDPRAGAKPAVGYSDVDYPSWLKTLWPYTVRQQYGCAFTSCPTFEHVDVSGFGACIAVQGCNSDGNGDYLNLRNCALTSSLIGVAWGNTQARLNSATNCQFVRLYEGISTNRIGSQLGKPHFTFDSCELGLVIKLGQVPNMAYGGAIVFNNCYGEVCYSLGNFYSTGSAAGSVSFIGGGFDFTHTGRPLPQSIIRTVNSSLRILGTGFNSLRIPFVIDGYPEMVEWGGELTNLHYKEAGSRAVAYMDGSTCGLMFLAANQGPWSGRGWRQQTYNPATGALSNPRAFGDVMRSNVSTVLPFCCRAAVGSETTSATPVSTMLGTWRAVWHYSQLKDLKHDGRTLTLEIPHRMSDGFMLNAGCSVGSIIYHDATKNLFLITEVDGKSITAKLLSGYHDRAGKPLSVSGEQGNYYFVPTGHYVPSHSTVMEWQRGKADVKFGRADGWAGFSEQFPVGAARQGMAAHDPLAATDERFSVVVESRPGNIKLSGPAMRDGRTDSGVWIMSRE